MRGVNDIFFRRFGAGKDADHVLRGKLANVVLEAGRGGHAEFNRLEALLLGSGAQLVEILPCGGKDFAGDVVLHPSVHHRARRRVLAIFGVGLRARPRAFDNAPAIAGRFGVVDDDRSRCTLTRGFFILVGPATVEGHRAAIERAFKPIGFIVGIVDQNNHCLAGDIDAFIIVPAALGRVDPVTDKNHLAVGNLCRGVFAIGHTDPFAAEVIDQIGVAIGDGERCEILAGNLDKRNILNPAVAIPGLKAGGSEAFSKQRDGQFLTFAARHAAFELVARQNAGDVLHRIFGKIACFDFGDVERGCGVGARQSIAARQCKRCCSCQREWRNCAFDHGLFLISHSNNV